ncbi:MAG: thermonuclease family protein [Pseudolabrys sp.]
MRIASTLVGLPRRPRPGLSAPLAAAVLAAAAFATGIGVAPWLRPGAPPAVERSRPSSPHIVPGGHPADLVRVIDGDTLEAQVHVWPGMTITTRVRLRGIDAPELRARCGREQTAAQAARDALAKLTADGRLLVSQIGPDKYGGRVVAAVATARGDDVSAALLQAGLVRRYSGGHRASWCD